MYNFAYLIKEGARGLFHAKLMTFVSIVTITVVLLVASAVTVIMITLWAHLGTAIERSDVVVYLTEAVAKDSAAQAGLIAAIGALPQVQTVALVDKNTAMSRFAEIYGREMLDAVDENPLPASFELTLKRGALSGGGTGELQTRLAALPGVEEVRSAREWLDFLRRFRQWLIIAGIAAAAVMIATLHLTITSTVKLTIYARRDLVRTMRLVGATRFFISMPFIIEGMLQGLAGGLAAGLFFEACRALWTHAGALSLVPVVWGPPALPLLFLVLGVIFGWIGSLSAVRKFLS